MLLLLALLALQGGQGGNPPSPHTIKPNDLALLTQGQHGKPPPGSALQGAGNGGIPGDTPSNWVDKSSPPPLPSLGGPEYRLITSTDSRWARVALAEDGTRAWTWTRNNQVYARLQNPDLSWKGGEIWLSEFTPKNSDECEVEASRNTFLFSWSQRYGGNGTVSMTCPAYVMQSDGQKVTYLPRTAPSINTSVWRPLATPDPKGGWLSTFTVGWGEDAARSHISTSGTVTELPIANAPSGASQSYSAAFFGRGRDLVVWQDASFLRAYRGRMEGLPAQTFTQSLSWECRLVWLPGEVAAVWDRKGRLEGVRLDSSMKPINPPEFLAWGWDAEIGVHDGDVIVVFESASDDIHALRWKGFMDMGDEVQVNQQSLGNKPSGQKGRRVPDVLVTGDQLTFSYQVSRGTSQTQDVWIRELPAGFLP